MITINEALKIAVEKLEQTINNPLLDAQVILCYILKVDRLYLIVNKDRILTDEQNCEYNKLIDKRISGVPVQYITGNQEFMGLDFYVEEGVLIPRSDTEILVEKVLGSINENRSYNIVEIGTGSGAITVSLAKFIHKAHIYSIDISKKALGIAKLNAEKHGVMSKINFFHGSLFKPLDDIGMKGKIDVLVSNPPYIPTYEIDKLQIEVSRYEPKIALDGGEDGLNFYREIVDKACEYLVMGGIIALEVGHNQARRVMEIMKDKNNYVDIDITKDLAGIKRVVSAKTKNV